ncbi:hypothetical protein [Alteromonas australica]|jgi:hypothetical protein|uniref:hypothetical protein n=1 Tax=Alteromonas australica TaxID=589873 RepID=UPI0023563406|nr:hypothetical protein [Alteromonas australica]|tara:strand:+ start:1976 stop:2503 length:528 start_codon:yes stop_codon:yes gene_type:complete
MTNDLGLNTFTKPDSVVVYQPSKTNAVVDVNNKSLKKVSVPSDTKLTIHLICIAYLNSVACKKLTHLHRKNIVLSIELLFRFIKQKGYQTDGDVPTTLFEKFTTYLNKHTGKQGYSVRDTLNKAKAPFEWALRNPELSEVKQFDTTSFRAFLVYIPHIPKGKHEKKPPLSVMPVS